MSAKSFYGKLWYDGKVLLSGRTFPVLQAEKKRLLATGYYKKELFRITY
mgnify:CR=1 FL=1